MSTATAAPANSPVFDNVFVWVTKIALIPAAGDEFPDANGEVEQENSQGENGKSGIGGFVTITLETPVQIDLLNPPSDRNIAFLLNRFSETPVPAGEYSKIRIYYDNVVGHKAGVSDTLFHPTAHYHFDVHFVGGNLVIPVTAPQDGVEFFSVVIRIVGLKYHQAGNSGNVLLRPQVFAEFLPPILFSVRGTASNVVNNLPSSSVSGSFDVTSGTATPVHVTFDNNTGWAYSDDVLAGSSWTIDPVPNQRAVAAFKDRAKVMAIGTFAGGTLQAMDIIFTFPDVRAGVVDNGWRSDNTFVLRLASDNVVFPKPDRFTAFYDNLIAPHGALTQAAIDNNVAVKGRGYAVTGGIDAYWISIGP